MKNLENFGVLELGAKEIKEIDGGSWRWVYRAASALWEATAYSASRENAERFYGNNADNPYSKL